jgi:hypothetical protein
MLTQTAVRTPSWREPTRGHVPPAAARPRGGPLDIMGAQMPFSRNAEIYGEGEAADYIYRVISGAVRTYKVLDDPVVSLEPFTCRATCSALSLETSTRSQPKPLPTRKCW